jgi:hypothetical protein
MRPKKNGDPTKRKFAYDSEYGTAQQRLADAITMGGTNKDVNRLLTVMNYMGGNQASPLEVQMAQNYTPNFYDNSPAPEMDMRVSGIGRVFQETPGSMMRVQTPSQDPRYDYMNEGGPLRANNIGSITGYQGDVGSRDARLLNELLQNPDFVNYFTDIYGSADKDYRGTPPARGRESQDWSRGVVHDAGPKGTATGGYTRMQTFLKNCALDPSCRKAHGIGIGN